MKVEPEAAEIRAVRLLPNIGGHVRPPRYDREGLGPRKPSNEHCKAEGEGYECGQRQQRFGQAFAACCCRSLAKRERAYPRQDERRIGKVSRVASGRAKKAG